MTKEWAETGNHPKYMKLNGVIYHEDDFVCEFGGNDKRYRQALFEAEPLTQEERAQVQKDINDFLKKMGLE